MPFEKGHPKYGGRKKGVTNRSTLNINEVLNCNGFDVINELLTLYSDLNKSEKVHFCFNLMPYVTAKKKPLDEQQLKFTDTNLDNKSIEELESIRNEIQCKINQLTSPQKQIDARTELKHKVTQLVKAGYLD